MNTYRVLPIWQSDEVNITRNTQQFVRAASIETGFEVVSAMLEWDALKERERELQEMRR